MSYVRPEDYGEIIPIEQNGLWQSVEGDINIDDDHSIDSLRASMTPDRWDARFREADEILREHALAPCPSHTFRCSRNDAERWPCP